MKGCIFQNCILLAIKMSLPGTPTEPRNEVFSPVTCLLSKTKPMSLIVLIQVWGLSFKREKIKAKDWLQASLHQFYSSRTRKPVPVVLSDGLPSEAARGKRAELAPAQYCVHQAYSMVLLARSSHGLLTAFIWLIFSLSISYYSSSAFNIRTPPGSLTFPFQIHPGLHSKLWYNPQTLNVSQALFPKLAGCMGSNEHIFHSYASCIWLRLLLLCSKCFSLNIKEKKKCSGPKGGIKSTNPT